MPRQPRHAVGHLIGRWKLVELLGVGGNAEVWAAVGDDKSSVALKILTQVDMASEPFLRFRDEVELLQRMESATGVLPLISFHLPPQASRRNPAWLAMPIATPVRAALGAMPSLDDVVQAVARFALTLSDLHGRGVFHRDLKPDNLYRYESSWCVGDFGLATFPDKEAITAVEGHIGPFYYLAPEVLVSRGYDAGAADVFALAKTLWVLASGQTFPVPGVLSHDIEYTRLSAFINHERVRSVERLLERATQTEPQRRPTMTAFAEELKLWLEGIAAVRVDASQLDFIRDRVRFAVSSQTNAEINRQRRKDYVIARLEHIKGELLAIGGVVQDVTGLSCTYGAWGAFTDDSLLLPAQEIPNYDYRHHVASIVQIPRTRGKEIDTVTFTSGIALMSTTDEMLVALAAHRIKEGAHKTSTVWSHSVVVPLDSEVEKRAVVELCTALGDALPTALGALSQALEQA